MLCVSDDLSSSLQTYIVQLPIAVARIDYKNEICQEKTSFFLCQFKRLLYLCIRKTGGAPVVTPDSAYMVDVVQLVRASDCGSECRGFESHPPPLKESCNSLQDSFFVMDFSKKSRASLLNSLDLNLIVKRIYYY